MKSDKYTQYWNVDGDPKSPVINIYLLPEDQQTPFLVWANHCGDVFLVIDNEMCALASDYELWYDYWIKNEEAPIE